MVFLAACAANTPVEEPVAAAIRVEIGEEVVCADPSARGEARYDGFALGVVGTQGGVLVADLDGDEALDLYLPQAGPDALWLGDGTGDFTAGSLPEEQALGETAVAGDLEGDRDLDVYVGNRGPDLLLRNDGGSFVAEELPNDAYTSAVAMGDIDGDDDLDVFAGRYPDGELDLDAITAGTASSGGNGLYENDGGALVDVSERLPAEVAGGLTYAVVLQDLDGDGAADLYTVNDFGMWMGANGLARGDGEGNFSAATNSLAIATYGMGVATGDLNGDRLPDLLVTSWGELHLLLSDRGDWYDAAAARGLHGAHVGWGTELADFDDDADLDALVVYGHLPLPEGETFTETNGLSNPDAQPDALFVQGEGFVDEAAAWNLDDDGVGRGVVVADLDRNGWLDVVRTDLEGTLDVQLARCGEADWLEVELRQPGPNAFAVGARIDVGEQTRWITAGGGLGSGGPPEAHFGTGGEMTVTWPDGAVSTVRDPGPRRRVRVVRE